MSDRERQRPSRGGAVSSGRGGLLPPVGARTPGIDELGGDGGGGADRRDEEWDDDWEPNYLVRRAIVVGAVVVVIAVVAIVIGQLLGGDDDGDGGAVADTRWSHVVVLTADEVRVVDPADGNVVDAFDSADDLLDAQSLVSGDALVTMTDGGRITITDLDDGATRRGRSGVDESLLRSRDQPAIALSSLDTGGDLTVVDTPNRQIVSVGDVAGLADPLMFANVAHVNPGGTHVAASDGRTFQTVVVDLTEETAELLAGQIVAINDAVVVTAQRAGDETEIEFHDLTGERLGSVDVPTPVATMLTTDDRLVTIDASGEIRLVESNGDVELSGRLVDPDPDAEGTGQEAGPVDLTATSGVDAFGHDRLLVTTGDGSTAVVDARGQQVGVFPGTVSSTVDVDTRCVLLGSGRSSAPSSVLDLDPVDVIAELERGLAADASRDGCTMSIIGGDGVQVVAGGEVLGIDADSILSIAPDGAALAVTDGRDTELVTIGEDGSTELADEQAVVHFAQR